MARETPRVLFPLAHTTTQKRGGNYRRPVRAASRTRAAAEARASADLGLLPLDFVEQHRVQHLVFDRFDLSVRGTCDEIRVDLGHFLGNQTVLYRLGAIVDVSCSGR